MQPYRPADIEAAVQAHWTSVQAFRAREDSVKPKFYCVSMLPYPSGVLHMGHVRNYMISDMMYRHLRMNGHNTLMPMGWDAFGLPAENAAMKSGVAPARWTYDNIAYMKRQMQVVGLAIDWSRELATCKPDYYRWNQWLFLKMLERGIAYKKTGVVNWDPVDQTVLANEQVIDGRGWRSGALVQRREIPMYYLKITDYADELLDNLDRMTGWPERVRTMQANWIGRSEGVRFAFPHDIRESGGALIGDGRLWVFTTRADTIMGVTFCAVAAEHPLAVHAAQSRPDLAVFVEECRRGGVIEAELATMEKKGMPTGLHVRHPLTGEPIEVWVGNYVLMAYGEGAVMGVPAHDERDFAFAKKYGLPIRQVIAVDGEMFTTAAWQPWYEDKSRGVCVNSGKYDGMRYEAAVAAIAADLEALGLGAKQITYRLRDWGISRQRYWGTPIPIVHCPACGDVPVPEDDLPVVLPEDCVPDGTGNPLAKRADFVATTCPRCDGPAQRETDTMDTFVDSSWYYMRYACPGAATMVDARNEYWNPMDQYIGGIEHAILHLLYARFWTKVMRDMGLVGFDEPFTRLMTQGMLLNHSYFRRTDHGGIDYFAPEDVDPVRDGEGRITGAVLKSDGQPVEYGGTGTMSKSKRNGVDPQELIAKYGADTARMFVMHAGPPEDSALWSDDAVEGAYRFLKRLWAYAQHRADALARVPVAIDWAHAPPPLREIRRELHMHLKQADDDYRRVKYNTVVSAGIKMLHALDTVPEEATPAAIELVREGLSLLLRVLNPVVPHITHALWEQLGYAVKYGDILDAPWPQVDAAALAQDEIELVLQVNGKLRGKLRVSAVADSATIERAAVASPEVQKQAQGATPRRIVIVPGRLVNVVV
ncbi:MAG TPA: leucine--tRNA ligase [Casimicrobiaceae bacterium]|jgi:leucyl-tRNA synthetase|nr:leucine--tRNA ligase [Casimicrobiaceae bacterium]